MSRTIRRLYSSVAPSGSKVTAEAVAAQFLEQSQASPPRTHTQLLDINQLHRLASTLNRLPHYKTAKIHKQTPEIPPCHHLVYFTPDQLRGELGLDGTDTTYNPQAPFTRRMWAGGSLTWAPDNRLHVGDLVTETTKVLSAEAKCTKAGEDMVVVGVEKTFENAAGWAVKDRRNWIFRPKFTEAPKLVGKPEGKQVWEEGERVGTWDGRTVRAFTHSNVDLFRFSALTFNAHRIHYDASWCRRHEGHRNCVVHGPLNLIHMVDLWRDVVEKKEGEKMVVPKSVSYRATSPLYVNEQYRLVAEEEKDKITELKIVDGWGNTSMKGTIERF